MIQQSHSLVFTQMTIKRMPSQPLHKDVYSSFIHNFQDLEATKMFFSRWVEKETLVHADNWTLFNSKKKWSIKPSKDMEES